MWGGGGEGVERIKRGETNDDVDKYLIKRYDVVITEHVRCDMAYDA